MEPPARQRSQDEEAPAAAYLGHAAVRSLALLDGRHLWGIGPGAELARVVRRQERHTFMCRIDERIAGTIALGGNWLRTLFVEPALR
jgi:hypothetical protein